MTTSEVLTLLVLAIIPLELTVVMFLSRQMMLGFPTAMFWMVLGGYAYTESTTPWGDWQYFLFFASMGMVIFSIMAMYGLRERKDSEVEGEEDEGADWDKGLIGERETPRTSSRSEALQERAANRRAGHFRRRN